MKSPHANVSFVKCLRFSKSCGAVKAAPMTIRSSLDVVQRIA